ncbi:MAG: FMN-binding protein [Lachnospiraceae bacterium]|nr:FMN-binding protein [Lachnospiraceae bacterium]
MSYDSNHICIDNTVEVDTVSGATMSSEVIKAAVRDALRSDL